MFTIYQSRDKAREVVLAPGIKVPRPVKETDQRSYVYLLMIEGADNQPPVIQKAGITGNIYRRMATLSKKYGAKRITVLWVSPLYAESTARRLEWQLKQIAKSMDWVIIPKDRFIIPKEVKEFQFTVRKTYTVTLP